jgi:peptidyl-prolyl cis-trans isomerase B (cyclophilin B)
VKAALSLALMLLIVGCGGPKQVSPQQPAAATPTPVDSVKPAEPTAATGEVKGMLKDTLTAGKVPANLYLTIQVRDYGTMKVKFYGQDAPKNVTNVANLAIKGFYNGLTFHRIVPGFVVQGGDPKGDGTGGPGYTIAAEIKRKHEKGALAMARTGDQVNPKRESSGSQFYLCLQPLLQLDGQYTVIGQLVEGMAVLDKLGKAKTGPGDRPEPAIIMDKVFVTTE